MKNYILYIVESEEGMLLNKDISDNNGTWVLEKEIVKGLEFKNFMKFVYESVRECEENITWYTYLREQRNQEPLDFKIKKLQITFLERGEINNG